MTTPQTRSNIISEPRSLEIMGSSMAWGSLSSPPRYSSAGSSSSPSSPSFSALSSPQSSSASSGAGSGTGTGLGFSTMTSKFFLYTSLSGAMSTAMRIYFSAFSLSRSSSLPRKYRMAASLAPLASPSSAAFSYHSRALASSLRVKPFSLVGS
jgi:hypothetical protein